MHKLYELKEKLMDELEAYSQNGKFSKEDVESIKYISSAIDHICNICESADGEYSGNMMGGGGTSFARGGGSYRMDDRNGGSYARGGRRGRGGANQYGSYAMGYSRTEDDFRMELQELIKNAPNDHIRQKMQSIMNEV